MLLYIISRLLGDTVDLEIVVVLSIARYEFLFASRLKRVQTDGKNTIGFPTSAASIFPTTLLVVFSLSRNNFNPDACLVITM